MPPPQVDTYSIYCYRALLASPALLPVQATRVALFPVRPMLLRDDPQLRVHLVLPQERGAVHRMLLPLARVARERGDHLAQQSCLPRPGQSDVAVHTHIRAAVVHGDKVCFAW